MKKENQPLIGVMIILVLACIFAVVIGRNEDRQKRGFVVPVASTVEETTDIPEISTENAPKIENTETSVESRETTQPSETTQYTAIVPVPETTEAYYDEVEAVERSEYIGYFKLTAYEWTGQPMANGEMPYYGACACNIPELWGKTLYIEGLGTFKVCDRGGMSGNWIDIYLGDEATCDAFGVQYAEVYYG